MTHPVLQKTIYLKADSDTVWDYLTQPDRLAEWFQKPSAPLVEGGALEMFGRDSGDRVIWGKVRVARQSEYLECSFSVKSMSDAVSLVKWHLAAVECGTRLSLEHEGLPETTEGFGLILVLNNGWDEHLAKMRKALHAPVPA